MPSSQSAKIAVVADPKEGRKWVSRLKKEGLKGRVLKAETALEALEREPQTIEAVVITNVALDGAVSLLGQCKSFPQVEFFIIAPGQSLLGDESNLHTRTTMGEVIQELVKRFGEISSRPLELGNLPAHAFVSTQSSAEAPQIPGSQFPVRSPLGKGAAGEVWIAKHQLLRKLVALKILNERALILEMHGLQRYCHLVDRHPDQFIPIFDPPEHLSNRGGIVYYATELADCLLQDRFPDPIVYEPHTLNKDVRARSRSAEEAVRITISLLEQAELLHMGGLIHGDIKLGNIVLYKRQPRLLDVTLIGNILHDGNTRGEGAGTRGFVPPEGHGQPSGDLYSLGKVLYLLLVRETDEAIPQELSEENLDDIAKLHLEPIKFIRRLKEIIARACSVRITMDGVLTLPDGFKHAEIMIRELRWALRLRQECLRDLEQQELKRKWKALVEEEQSDDQKKE